MGKGKVAVLLTFVLVLSMLAGCGTSAEPVPATEESALSGGQAEPLTGGAATAGEAAAAGQGVEATATELSTAVDLASVTEDIEDHVDAEAEVLENLRSTSIV